MTQNTGGKRSAPPFARKEIILACGDTLAFYASMRLALYTRFGGLVPEPHLDPYVSLLPILVAWRLVVAYGVGLYDFRHRLTLTDHLFAGVGAALAGVGGGYVFMAVVLLYYAPEFYLSRLSAALDLGFMVLWFAASRAAVLVWLRVRGYRVRILLIGPPEVCREITLEIGEHAPSPVEIAAIHVTEPHNASRQVRKSLERLCNGPQRYHSDQIVLIDVDLPQCELRSLMAACDKTCADCYLFPGLNLSILASSRLQSIAGLPLVPLRLAFSSSLYRPVKRIMDIGFAIAGLVLSAPLVAAAAVAMRFSSPGPVFLAQDRVGLHGTRFRLFKLRTMVADAEADCGPVLATDDDPRITRVGRLIRRFRVDELPQLWNILRGEMSLVGPRPERPEFVAKFVSENPLYERRELIKPGLTGLAQIHGRYDTPYVQKLRYDLIYLNSISFAADLRIITATVRTVLTGRGAV